MSSDKQDISGWASVMLDYRAIAVNMSRGMLEDSDTAEDVVQVVMMTITKKLSDGDLSFADRLHLRNYFLRAVRNRATDVIKDREKWARDSEGVLSTVSSGVEDPLQSLITNEEVGENERRMDGLVQSLRALKKKEREVILLRFMRGMKYREISDMTGVPITTLKSREDSALRKLRKTIVKSELVP